MQNPKSARRVACDACRLRKIRCSRMTVVNDSPACEACARASETCTFELPVKRRGPKPKSLRRFGPPFVATTGPDNESPDKNVAQDHDSSQSPPVSDDVSRSPAPRVVSDARRAMEQFCSPPVLHKLIRDFIDRMHCLTPIVHVPTFLTAVEHGHHLDDPVLAAVVLTICALVVATMPRRVPECRALDPEFPYKTNKEILETAKGMVQTIQRTDYYNDLTLDKWTVAYGMGLAMVQLGYLNEGKKYHAEANMILIDLGANWISSYEKFGNIKAQMLKKAFWLDVSSQSHLRLQRLAWDSLADRFAFENSDAEHLYPAQLDDEQISDAEPQKPVADRTPKIVGFLASVNLHICLSSLVEESSPILMTWFSSQQLRKRVIGNCQCGRNISPAPPRELLEHRLRKVQSLLDELPPELRVRQHDPAEAMDHDAKADLTELQFEIMAANIHITVLWVQSLLSETIIALSDSNAASSYDSSSPSYMRAWEMREHICRQLLNALGRFSPASFEASGMILIFKIRQVASTLMEYKFGEDNQVSFHAELYSKAFAERLGQLYLDSEMPTQTGGMDEVQRYQHQLGLPTTPSSS